MTTVRTYGNLAEAGFAKSLLESVGIRAELANENSYGIGYGPIVSELQLQVDEADLERARKVLAEGPDAGSPLSIAAPKESLDSEVPAKGARFPAGIFIASGVAFLALLFAVSQLREKQRTPDTTEHEYKFDDDDNGRTDRFMYYRGGTIARVELDRNGDGKIDDWEEYNSKGVLVRILSDNNFDGAVDLWSDYENGEVKTEKADLDFNGVPDAFIEFQHGLPVRAEVKPNGSAKGSRTETYLHGQLDEQQVDSDGDGKPDYRIKYDAFTNPSEHLPIDPK